TPTLRAMAAAVDALRGGLQPAPGAASAAGAEQEADYAADLDALLAQVPQPTPPTPYMAYPPAIADRAGAAPTFLLTGATGFLGAFVLAELLRRHPAGTVVCLTRARTPAAALARVREAAEANHVWDAAAAAAGRVRAVVGDLAKDRLGLSAADWAECARAVDAVVHNGALVHWVYPYARLRAPNVLSTLWVLRLAAEHRVKPVTFVSSTSALDTDHYVALGASLPAGIRESDDLQGSRRGLQTGYGQSKWVAENLMARARQNGLPVTVVRPGYVLGHSRSGVTNTDDFIWRLAKGCVELRQSPVMNNSVNLCAVDYVAHVVVEAITQPRALAHLVYHVFNAERFRFQDLFDALRAHGYAVADVEYMAWRSRLMDYTLAGAKDSALFPLLHYVLDDLPTSTKSPDLDDAHTRALLDGTGIACPSMRDLMGRYLAYLVKAQFLPAPPGAAAAERQLPELDIVVRGLVSRNN
ncbi:large subunit of alpha-aminoadipate reductase, partial [Coemansia sp. RSA 2049]